MDTPDKPQADIDAAVRAEIRRLVNREDLTDADALDLIQEMLDTT